MQPAFDSTAFCRQLGSDLVRMFQQADAATTPGLVGEVREHQPRRQLTRLLPLDLGVGSGCVVDSFGGTSLQQDIVVFEQALCPTFSIGESAAATYFPCEGVVACGEVKSQLGKKELDDALNKTSSVRDLKRYEVPESNMSNDQTIAYRSYGSTTSFIGTAAESFDQANKVTDRVRAFVIAGTLAQSQHQVCERVAAALVDSPTAVPDLVCVLDAGCVVMLDGEKRLTWDCRQAAQVVLLTPQEPFAFLALKLIQFAHQGRTVKRDAFGRYFGAGGGESIPIAAAAPVLRWL